MGLNADNTRRKLYEDVDIALVVESAKPCDEACVSWFLRWAASPRDRCRHSRIAVDCAYNLRKSSRYGEARMIAERFMRVQLAEVEPLR